MKASTLGCMGTGWYTILMSSDPTPTASSSTHYGAIVELVLGSLGLLIAAIAFLVGYKPIEFVAVVIAAIGYGMFLKHCLIELNRAA